MQPIISQKLQSMPRQNSIFSCKNTALQKYAGIWTNRSQQRLILFVNQIPEKRFHSILWQLNIKKLKKSNISASKLTGHQIYSTAELRGIYPRRATAWLVGITSLIEIARVISRIKFPLLMQICQKSLAACQYILIGCLKISRIPRVSNISGMICIIQ